MDGKEKWRMKENNSLLLVLDVIKFDDEHGQIVSFKVHAAGRIGYVSFYHDQIYLSKV